MLELNGTPAAREGVLFSQGDQHIILPTLPIGKMRRPPLRELIGNAEALGERVREKAGATGRVPWGEYADALAENWGPVILAALQLNYPNATLDDVTDWMTLDNAAAMYRVAIGAPEPDNPNPPAKVRLTPPPVPVLTPPSGRAS